MARLSVVDLARAGFNEDQILGFIEDQRKSLKAAGFSDLEINDHFGIKQTNSSAIKPEHLSSPVENIYMQHNELGKMDNVTKQNNEEKILDDKDLENKADFANKKLFKEFSEEDKKSIFQMAMSSMGMFQGDEEGRIGFMDSWLSNNYPNLDVTNLNEINDISILESAINDNYEKGKDDVNWKRANQKNRWFIQKYQMDKKIKEKE